MRVNMSGVSTTHQDGDSGDPYDDHAYVVPRKRQPGVIVKAFDTEKGGANPLRTKDGELMASVLIGFPDLEGRPGIWYRAPFEGKWAWRGKQLLHACGYHEDAEGYIDYEARDLVGAPIVCDIEDWERNMQNSDRTLVLDETGVPIKECVSQITRLHVTRGGGAPTQEAAKADAETPTEGDLW